ncbi:MAG: hypothetical protein GY869_27980 [Planctomycetes bacterium]|nr:hypothetical protein [Planctomycetota bacterium]
MKSIDRSMIDHIDLSSTLRRQFLPILGGGSGSSGGDIIIDGATVSTAMSLSAVANWRDPRLALAPRRASVDNPRRARSGADSADTNRHPTLATGPMSEVQATCGARYQIGKRRDCPSGLRGKASRPTTRSGKPPTSWRH